MMALIMIKKSEFLGFLDEFLNDECTIYRHCAAVALVEKKNIVIIISNLPRTFRNWKYTNIYFQFIILN